MIVSYDLLGTDENQEYTVVIKYSGDNFVVPLKEIKGDVGENITPGLNKKIDWNATKQLGKFKGGVSFEITASLTFTPIKFIAPTKGEEIKLGKNYQVKWKGGLPKTRLKMELLRNNALAYELPETTNIGTYTWKVPKTITSGEGFSFKLTDVENPTSSIISSNFKI